MYLNMPSQISLCRFQIMLQTHQKHISRHARPATMAVAAQNRITFTTNATYSLVSFAKDRVLNGLIRDYSCRGDYQRKRTTSCVL